MRIVLDASAALSLVAAFESSPVGRVEAVLVPDLYVAEVSSAMWKNHRFGAMPLQTCTEVLSQLLKIPTQIVPTAEFAPEVFELAIRYGHSPYDLFYLLLAAKTESKLCTKDKALIRLAHRYGIETV